MRDVQENVVLHQAVEKWGNEAQVNQAIEEMGELIVALNHYRRGRAKRTQVQEEIADVMIMAEQLAIIFGDVQVQLKRYDKFSRLAQRLSNDMK